MEQINDRKLLYMLKEGTEDQKNKACKILLDRYEKQIHKNWWILTKQMKNSYNVLSIKEEYYSEALEYFYKAVLAVDMSKIENDSWKFVGYFNFYLRNLRTKLIKEIIKDSAVKSLYQKNESLTSSSLNINRDVEMIAYQNNHDNNNLKFDPLEEAEKSETQLNCNKIIKNLYDSWDSTKQQIFIGLRDGLTRIQIAEKLERKPGYISNIAKKMQHQVAEELKSKSN